jgi:hypothetical protein
VEGAVCRGCGDSNSPSWERLWKALYVEDVGPVTARVEERLWKALYVEDAANVSSYRRYLQGVSSTLSTRNGIC